MLIQKQSQTSKSILIEKIKDKENKPTRYYSDKHEKSVAKAVKGKQTSNSGATPWQKSDILTENNLFALECKTKTKSSDSISIKKEWFLKQKEETVFMGKKHSAIVFNFGPDEPNHYIIDEYLFQYLLKCLSKEEEE